MQRDGEANAQPASIAPDRGASFAAEYTATRVKPSCRWTQAEANSFASALKGAARVTPCRDRELNWQVELRDSIYRGRLG